MESLFSSCLSSSPPFLNPSKTPKSTSKSHLLLSNHIPNLISFRLPSPTNQTPKSIDTPSHSQNNIPSLKPHFSLLLLGLPFPFPCSASEASAQEASTQIDLESVLISIDNFFNRYPFFVYTVAFIWFIAIPLTEEYLQKYKYMSAFNAFRKLRDDPNSQFLDIRDSKSVVVLGSPNLKILSKSVAQVEYREGDEDGFLKRVLQNFGEPNNTTVCIIDNFDGNSFKVAELLVKNGFKEAYAIRGGIMGKNGWQDIQQTLLPPSVHVYRKKRTKKKKHLDTNGGVPQQAGNNDPLSINGSASLSKVEQGPLSPYPNYPDFRPPSSPTPSKPK